VPAIEPLAEVNAERDRSAAVVLLDEIDKADPDMPNGLLVPLGSTEFVVTETGTVVRRGGGSGHSDLLIVITTNEERELPPAFLRRCVVHQLEPPDEERLVEIARRHLGQSGAAGRPSDEGLASSLATRVMSLRTQAQQLDRRPPSTAEYLDALHTCRALHVDVGSQELWDRVERLVLAKETAEGS
jgi:MoxR-like ATPase